MEANQSSLTTNEAVAGSVAQIPAIKSKAKIDIKQPARLLIIVLLLGWTFDFLFWKQSLGINFAIFFALCLIGGSAFLLLEGDKPSRNSLWLLLPFVFFAVITFARQEPVTVFLAYTFTLFSIGLFATSYLGGRWPLYRLSNYLLKSLMLVGDMIVFPINLFLQITKAPPDLSKDQKAFPFLGILRGLLIAVPIVLCLGSLLASGDVVFNQKIRDFFDTEKLTENLQRFSLIILIAYVLAGIFLHAMTKSKDEKITKEAKPFLKPFLGLTEAMVVLGSVIALFLIFVSIQFQYFFGGEKNIGVEGFTYSQYARRGFNELLTVAFFSLLLIIGLSMITRREEEKQKRVYSGLSAAVVGLVMIILLSAYQRISLAIDWHGFSRLRLYPRIFLIWLAILLVVVVLLEIYRLERYFVFASVLASIGFAVSLALVNVDAATVRHNVPRVLQGKNLNVAHLASLSLDAVPALADEFFSKSLPTSAHEGVGAALSCYKYYHYDPRDQSENWRAFNLSAWRAQKALEKVRPYLVGYYIKNKTGKVHTPSNSTYECHYYERSAED